jgi:hypothetical protein
MRLTRIVQLALLIVSVSGCTTNSTMVTFYGNRSYGYASFKDDLKQCKSSSEVRNNDDTEPKQPDNSDYDYDTSLLVNSCLTDKGWRPELQFVSETEATFSELQKGIEGCSAQNSADKNSVMSCISSLKGKIIASPPWFNTKESGEPALPLANYPVYLSVSDEIKDLNNIVFRDNSLALSWSIPEENFLSWESAVSKLRDINSTRYAGKNDWRIPSKSELESFITNQRNEALVRFVTGSGNSGKLDGLFWTDSFPRDNNDRRFALDFSSGAFSVLDTSGPFVCKLMVVRGKGW